MNQRIIAQVLRPFGRIHPEEASTVILMFLYSFLIMAAHSIIKPATRSTFIESLGSDNLPYVQLVAGAIIGFVMVAYGWLMTCLPRHWCVAITQGSITIVLLVFWFLFRSEPAPVLSAAFYLFGLILGLLLISQFWALANVVFDPRQARRLFGFIGAGASLGGILGAYLAIYLAKNIGTEVLLLLSAGFMLLSIAAAGLVVRRERHGEGIQDRIPGVEKAAGGKETMRLLRESKHLRLIALIIGFAAVGAVIIDLQLNMAAEAALGAHSKDAITVFLARVQLWASTIGLLIQLLLTSRIHRHLGIGFALLMLPIGLGSTAVVVLMNAALWAPGLARVVDQSLRYTIGQTTCEVLYMPLPPDMKFTAKPFVDVTVDRFAKGLAAVLLLFLIKPWGLGLSWQKLSFASIVLTAVWIFLSLRAKKEYRQTFRNSIRTRGINPVTVPAAVADSETIETLIQELASPDENRVLYAIEFLESLDKKELVTPLLLHHESPVIRARALSVISSLQPSISARWLPAIRSMLTDADPNVRSAAVGALARVNNQEAGELVRPLLRDQNPRIALTAAMVLAGSSREEDVENAEDILNELVASKRESAASIRLDFAIAIRHVPIPRYRRLLIPLLNDSNQDVVEEAMRSIRKLGATDLIFIPTFISLLHNRRFKGSARNLLVGFGDSVLPILNHFLRDPDENIWIRRHIPEIIARIPAPKSMNILIEALDDNDGFLRFHVIAALEKIHRAGPGFSFDRRKVEAHIQEEIVRCARYRRLYRILFELHHYPEGSLVARTLVEKMRMGKDRIYRLLGLLYPWKDIAAARQTIEHGDGRSRAGTLEYLDNILTGSLRKSLIPLLEDAPSKEIPAIFNRTGDDSESAVIGLIHDEDPVVASAAIFFVWQQGLTGFSEELDRVLETRNIRDRQALEAASWALQEFRNPASKKRFIRLEPLPSVDIADRIRGLPLFASVTIDEIFRICDTGRQVRFEPEQILFQESLVPENVHFLLSGLLEVIGPGGETRRLEAPAVFGLQEVLEERPMTEYVCTADTTVCLTLNGNEIFTLLADNRNLLPGIFQALYLDSYKRRFVEGDRAALSALQANGSYSPIEKGLVLQSIPVFSQVSTDEIVALAAIAPKIRLVEGMELIDRACEPAIYALISGELSIQENMKSPLIAGPSDVVGLYETLSGSHFEFKARVLREGIALRISHEDLFDLFMQRAALLRQVLSRISHRSSV